jgi:hypothetical protein
MAGFFIFSPDDPNIGFTTGTDLAVNVFLDILTDTLYYTDGENIFQWEGDATDKTYTWRSAKLRFPRETNLGAALIEAESYVDVVFNLYADGVLRHSETVKDGEPFRLPGGYMANIFEMELVGTDIVQGVSVAENIFDLAAG